MDVRNIYQTPDEPSGGVKFDTFLVRVPRVSAITRAVEGAIVFLSYLSTWTDDGSMSRFAVSQLIKEMLNGARKVDFLLGSIVPIWTSEVDENLIIADGRTVDRDDYPELWEIAPVGMRTATTLTVPDLRDRFILGAGTIAGQGVTGGAQNHTLTIDQMPPHTHGYTSPTFGIDIITAGAPDPTGVGNPPTALTTTPTGGGLPHNNMPPYYSMTYAIVGRL